MKEFHLLLAHLVLSSVSFSFVADATMNNVSDLSALISFKASITGDPFGALSSWNGSLHYCEWQGVTCGHRHAERVTALVLDAKQLSGHVSSSLSNLTFLQRLDLRQNRFVGGIPMDIGHLSRLRYLNLSLNTLDGLIPSTLGNCSRLQFLNLKNNNLQGLIPSNLMQLRHLKTLILTRNLLVGGIPPSMGNLTSMLILDLSHNSLRGSIPSSVGHLKLLQIVYLNGCNLSGNLPSSIYSSNNLSAILHLELGDNMLHGTIPFGICNNFPVLEKLYLWGNQFRGPIPTSISNCSSLAHVDLQFNNFTGLIPSSIGKLQRLYWLAVNSNQLEAKTRREWGFVDHLSNCSDLQVLDLSNNQLHGELPKTIANLSASLYYLSLSANQISGSLPMDIDRLTNLTTLDLSHTLLGGTIPKELGGLWNLQELSLSDNMMVGEIPLTLGNLTQINELYLENNNFSGSIPAELGKHKKALVALDIANNRLKGPIPLEVVDLPSLSIGIDLSYNNLSGSLPSQVGSLKNILEIALSSNNLSGEIPHSIDGCQILQNLYLDRNKLTGTIPSTLKNMRGLQVLDLSQNFLSGEVPEFMGRMDLLYLNISFNNFDGRLPNEGIFRNLSAVDVRGNPGLCGGIPEMRLPKCPSDLPKHRHHFSRVHMVILLSVAVALLCLLGMISCQQLVIRRSQRSQHASTLTTVVSPHHYNNISYNELLKATSGFSLENLIGRGGYGVVYRGVLAFEGIRTNVAIKVLDLKIKGASRSFFSECETLRSVRHRNLIKVLNCCSSIDHKGNDFKALVFEYMPNGSLEQWLHLHPDVTMNRQQQQQQQQQQILNIMQRLNIAIDVAAALGYLHEQGPVPIVHCDLKPSNVLLDDELMAHVGDFGLAKFLVPQDATASTSTTNRGGINGSIGYIAPEYGLGSQPSVEGDTYSYGILLLETFTGVSPTDERFADGSSLRGHVEMAFPDRIMDVTDTRLISMNPCPGDLHGCLVSVLQCGLQCSMESPKERSTMKQVSKELESAHMKLFGERKV